MTENIGSKLVAWLKVWAICLLVYFTVASFFLLFVIPILRSHMFNIPYGLPVAEDYIRFAKASTVLASITTIVIWFARARGIDR